MDNFNNGNLTGTAALSEKEGCPQQFLAAVPHLSKVKPSEYTSLTIPQGAREIIQAYCQKNSKGAAYADKMCQMLNFICYCLGGDKFKTISRTALKENFHNQYSALRDDLMRANCIGFRSSEDASNEYFLATKIEEFPIIKVSLKSKTVDVRGRNLSKKRGRSIKFVDKSMIETKGMRYAHFRARKIRVDWPAFEQSRYANDPKMRRTLEKVAAGKIDMHKTVKSPRVYSILTQSQVEARQFLRFEDGSPYREIDVATEFILFLLTLPGITPKDRAFLLDLYFNKDTYNEVLKFWDTFVRRPFRVLTKRGKKYVLAEPKPEERRDKVKPELGRFLTPTKCRKDNIFLLFFLHYAPSVVDAVRAQGDLNKKFMDLEAGIFEQVARRAEESNAEFEFAHDGCGTKEADAIIIIQAIMSEFRRAIGFAPIVTMKRANGIKLKVREDEIPLLSIQDGHLTKEEFREHSTYSGAITTLITSLLGLHNCLKQKSSMESMVSCTTPFISISSNLGLDKEFLDASGTFQPSVGMYEPAPP